MEVSYLLGKVKLAPINGHNIPRLELCAALLATDITKIIKTNLQTEIHVTKFYTDSKVDLGYINNKVRRFYNYVSNRVHRILQISTPDQWNYIASSENPADHGTRGLHSSLQLEENWLTGPRFLHTTFDLEPTEKPFPLVNPDEDKEIRVEVNKVVISEGLHILHDITERFSTWKSLVSFIAVLKGFCRFLKTGQKINKGDLLRDAELYLLKLAQQLHFGDEIQLLRKAKAISKDSRIVCLSPYLDEDDVIRVGGRLRKSVLPREVCHPVILPSKSQISRLIVMYIHEKISHQGRHFTEGAVRNTGYWIIGSKRLVSSVIHRCVTCRKLRGQLQCQKMADLPCDRLTPGPPFTSVGVDTFGPWEITSRRTRGGLALSKRWAIMFTCLTTREIHIEVIESMTSSSFINAVRRLIALRGNIREFRSDMGTKFVDATEALKANKLQTT